MNKTIIVLVLFSLVVSCADKDVITDIPVVLDGTKEWVTNEPTTKPTTEPTTKPTTKPTTDVPVCPEWKTAVEPYQFNSVYSKRWNSC